VCHAFVEALVARVEDVLLELRLVLASPSTRKLSQCRGLCAGNGGADDGAGLAGAQLATLQQTSGQYFDGLTPGRALDQRVAPELQPAGRLERPAPIRSAWAPARSTTMSRSTACAERTFSASPEVT